MFPVTEVKGIAAKGSPWQRTVTTRYHWFLRLDFIHRKTVTMFNIGKLNMLVSRMSIKCKIPKTLENVIRQRPALVWL